MFVLLLQSNLNNIMAESIYPVQSLTKVPKSISSHLSLDLFFLNLWEFIEAISHF